jgi:hypothetical protein
MGSVGWLAVLMNAKVLGDLHQHAECIDTERAAGLGLKVGWGDGGLVLCLWEVWGGLRC